MKTKIVLFICVIGMAVSAGHLIPYFVNAASYEAQQEGLAEMKQDSAIETDDTQENIYTDSNEDDNQAAPNSAQPSVLTKYQELYALNHDMVGWLKIEGTNIDYPVMQTMDDEEYYLHRDFYGEDNSNGCLILDTDSDMGDGENEPSTNLIIHGHTMRSGLMFGRLRKYAKESYGRKHNIIACDSIYEEREYELIAAFYSQVYETGSDEFKYYAFFNADSREEFDYWYENIKALSLYDTGVTAEYGDEFLTLSCCSYQTEDGRFVVVAKRIK